MKSINGRDIKKTPISVLVLATLVSMSVQSAESGGGDSTKSVVETGTSQSSEFSTRAYGAYNPALFDSPEGLNFEAELGVGNSDNVTKADASGEVSSDIYRFSPKATYATSIGDNLYGVEYSGEIAKYTDDSDNDYVDHFLGARAQLSLSESASVDLSISYELGHDDLGDIRNRTGFATGQPISEVDQWRTISTGGRFSYGSEYSIARIEVDYNISGKRYSNNKTSTGELELDTEKVGVGFFYNIGPNIDLVAQVSRVKEDFEAGSYNNTRDFYLLGVQWNFTSATSGFIKYGQEDRENLVGGLGYSGDSWDIGVDWSPLTYSTFTLSSFQASSTSFGFGDFSISQGISLDWKHSWSNSIRSEMGIKLTDDEYQGSQTRNDDLKDYTLLVEYTMPSGTIFTFNYAHSERNSDTDRFDYTENSYEVSVTKEF